MIFDGPHACPRCTCCINVEDYAEEVQSDGRLIVYLYCDSCSLGCERLYERKPVGQRDAYWSFVMQVDHDWRKPRALAKFLNNLKSARVASSTADAPQLAEEAA